MIVEQNKTSDADFIYVNDANGGKFKIYLNPDGNLCIKSLSELVGVYIATKNCIILTSEYHEHSRKI